MHAPIKNIVIVGGGSAGWLTAGVIAAEHKAFEQGGIHVTLIESPDVKTMGVGEGTWPTMRSTLSKMGIRETDLFKECEAAFKQGAKFSKWVTGKDDDYYYHPLVIPEGYTKTDLASYWQQHNSDTPFAQAVNFQAELCEQGLAPKQISTPEYGAVANYAYHLNTTKLGDFLQKHCTTKLGVKHIIDHVTGVNSAPNGDIASIQTANNAHINGDLFIDCSGFKALLLSGHYGVPFIDKKPILFNDTALACHVPYLQKDDPIASHTISTAQSAGWIWDIGLPSRRGVGAVYSSAHTTQQKAEDELYHYIKDTTNKETADNSQPRKIQFNPGHRENFWHKNCVAVGMAAGFIEPLEASALMLVEMSAALISEDLPATNATMPIVAARFNQRFHYRWQRIIDFLKLHYILTKRTDSAYWIDNCAPDTIPQTLQDLMTLWEHQVPSRHDFPQVEEIFGSASWQYVLYGMGFKTQQRCTQQRFNNTHLAQTYIEKNQQFIQQLKQAMPTNRELIDKICMHGLQTI